MGVEIEETAIPVADTVAGACELLGLDPLYVANEGRLVAIGAPGGRRSGAGSHAPDPLGAGSVRAGVVTEAHAGLVEASTAALAAGGSSICCPASKCRGSADANMFMAVGSIV